MADCDHHHPEKGKGTSRLLAALAVITVFMVVEAIGGVLSGSLALLADATHMLTDALALALAASAHLIARRPADATYHFGYRRAQVLAAFVNGIALTILLAWIFFEACKRFFAPIDVDVNTMLIVATLGLGANIVAFFILHRDSSTDVNVRGAMLHVVSDLVGSVAAIIAAIVIILTGWTRIDPILSVLVALLIGRSAYRLVKETGHILLEGAPNNIDVSALTAGVKAAAPGIEDVHDVRIWQMTPGDASLTLHARLAESGDAELALDKIKGFLEEKYGIRQSTVQIEIGGACPDCLEENAKPAPVKPVVAASGTASGCSDGRHGAHASAVYAAQK